MQMLSAGGLPTPYSRFPSFEIPDGTQIFPPNLFGGAIKILDPQLKQFITLGPGQYRFIWLDRDPLEQAKSMAKLVAALHPGMPPLTEDQIEILAVSFKRDRPKANAVMLKNAQCHQILKLRFELILQYPETAALKLNRFCGGELDQEAMVTAVRPRGPECLPYMLEIEQLAEAEKGQ
jgi:hypothetical protein